MCEHEEKEFREFVYTLRSYVRVQDDQTLADTRDVAARKLAELPFDKGIELMRPYDLAAIISGAACVTSPGKIVSQPGHPAATILEKMVTAEGGARMYSVIARLLMDANQETSIRPYLYSAGKTVCKPQGDETALDDEVATDGNAPEDDENQDAPCRLVVDGAETEEEE